MRQFLTCDKATSALGAEVPQPAGAGNGPDTMGRYRSVTCLLPGRCARPSGAMRRRCRACCSSYRSCSGPPSSTARRWQSIAELLALLSLLARLRLWRSPVRGLQTRCRGDEGRGGRRPGGGSISQRHSTSSPGRHRRRHPAERPRRDGPRGRPDLLRSRGRRPAAAPDHRAFPIR